MKKSLLKRQSGGRVLIEDGELYKDPNGFVQESDSFSHDDPYRITETGEVKKVSSGKGGEIVNAESVVSDSFSQVKKGDRKNTEKEKVLKFKPREANEILQSSGLSWFKTKKTMSPSELIKEAEKQTGDYARRFQKEYAEDAIGQTTKDENLKQLESLPDVERIYDIVFEAQEMKKDASGLFDKQELAQYGGIPVSNNGLYEYPNQPVVVPSNNITMQGVDYPVYAFNNETGEFLETMQPNQDYMFDKVKEVLEVPVAQSGLRNQDRYRQLLKEAQDKYKKFDEQYQNAKTPSARKLAELNRQEAYNSVQYLSQRTTPEPEYSGVPWNPLEDAPLIPISQPAPYTGVNWLDNSQPSNAPSRTPVISETQTTPNASVTNPQTRSGRPSWDTGNYRPNNQTATQYTVGQGDWLSSIAAGNGLTTQQLIDANPQLADPNKLNIGDVINIPSNRVSTDGLTELQSRPMTTTSPTARQVVVPGTEDYGMIGPPDYDREGLSEVVPQAVNTAGELLGRINRDQGTFGIRAQMMAARNVAPAYRTEVPYRTLGYQEEDVTPYLDEIDSAVNQQLQYVNPNTSQGQAILNNIRNQSLGAKRQTINRVNAMNLQRRAQTDNMNVQLLNQSDMQQQQANYQYVNDTQQNLAAQDAAKIALGQELDNMIDARTRADNQLLYTNIKYPNFKYDPKTGEIRRIDPEFKSPAKAKFGMKKKS